MGGTWQSSAKVGHADPVTAQHFALVPSVPRKGFASLSRTRRRQLSQIWFEREQTANASSLMNCGDNWSALSHWVGTLFPDRVGLALLMTDAQGSWGRIRSAASGDAHLHSPLSPQTTAPLSGCRPEVVTKGLECYAEVLSSSAFPWSALMEAELESCLCQWADEVIAEQAADG